MERKIITTSDGSHSIYIPELNEHYHSIHGAVQESIHVFIEAGFKKIIHPNKKQEICILEIGFGSGLNALLTYMESQKTDVKINYTSIEAYPLNKEIYENLNYVSHLALSDTPETTRLKHIFNSLHSCEWNKEIEFSDKFILKKIPTSLQKAKLKDQEFDLIYFDAFGPPTQPEMWTEAIFSKIAASTKTKGLLVTYCAKGEVKRILKKTGFEIEALPGPPGKREMVRAMKA